MKEYLNEKLNRSIDKYAEKMAEKLQQNRKPELSLKEKLDAMDKARKRPEGWYNRFFRKSIDDNS